MYNKVIMMGRIVNDLELRSTPAGASVLSFRIAVDFFNVVAWRNEAEFISRYFAKGRMILIEGELQNRSYQDKNGNTAYITEIIVDRSTFTGEKANNTQGTSSAYQSYPGNAAKNAAPEHPAQTSNTAPTVSQGNNSDFTVESGEDDDYPF